MMQVIPVVTILSIVHLMTANRIAFILVNYDINQIRRDHINGKQVLI